MKNIPISELCYVNLDFEITDIFPENWVQRKEFSLYKNKARPSSALFFVCADIAVTFFPADGSSAISAQKGDIVFIPKGSMYHVHVSGETNTKIDTYTINFHLFDETHTEVLLNDRIEVLTNRKDNLQETHLKKLCDVFHRTGEAHLMGNRNIAKTKGEFFLLLDLIASSVSQNDDSYYPIRRGADAFCDEWNKNEKIEKYAQMCDVSVTYFYRCFRKWSGKSPVEYRNMLRLSNAESLLRCTDMKVQEISETVGFDDPFYFCRIFSNAYGLSPKHYRDQYQNV